MADQLAQGDQNASLVDILDHPGRQEDQDPSECIGSVRHPVPICCVMPDLFQGAGMKHLFVELLWDVATKFKDVEPFVIDKYNELASTQNITSLYCARIV